MVPSGRGAGEGSRACSSRSGRLNVGVLADWRCRMFQTRLTRASSLMSHLLRSPGCVAVFEGPLTDKPRAWRLGGV